MALTEEKLLRKKKEIETAKQELATLQGEQKALLQQLKDNHNCSDLKAAKTKIESLAEDMERLDETIETKSKEIEQKYFN